MTDPDTEMAFIRTLSVHGLILSGNISQEDKRERIRTAILSQHLERHCFNALSSETYAEAFRRCYGRSLEMRRVPRAPATPFTPVPPPPTKTAEPDDDDEDDEP
jgi:hypothetical protein